MTYVKVCTYRGIGYHLTKKGYWIFDKHPPGLWAHWERYLPYKVLVTEEGVKDAIDRCLSNDPIYTGDLRHRGD